MGVTSRVIPVRPPFDARGLLPFFAARAVPGIEVVRGGTYWRSLRLPHGAGVVELRLGEFEEGGVRCGVYAVDARDVDAAFRRCERLLDAAADPVAISAVLEADPLLAPVVRQSPGRRVPGTVDGAETAIRAVIAQQISIVGARTIAGRLVQRYGTALPDGLRAELRNSGAGDGVTHTFPEPGILATAESDALPMPDARQRTIRLLATALASSHIVLEESVDASVTRRALQEIPGIGPWTAGYVAMRALGDRDAFLASDLGVRRAARRLGLPDHPVALAIHAERWRPWRAYALHHLWATLS